MTLDLSLREFVATRLMGWERDPYEEQWKRGSITVFLPALLPAYETDWAAMGMVIEAMRARGWRFSIPEWAPDNDGDYCVGFYKSTVGDFYDYAPELPLAVCLAVKAALESERKDSP